MNNEHPNISIIKRFDPTNLKAFSEVLAEDFVWHYINPELPQIEGDYPGGDGLQDFFEKISGTSKGTFGINPVSATPIGDELVAVHSVNTLSIEDRPMEIDALVVWRIVDNKIKEAWDIPAVYTARLLQN